MCFLRSVCLLVVFFIFHRRYSRCVLTPYSIVIEAGVYVLSVKSAKIRK